MEIVDLRGSIKTEFKELPVGATFHWKETIDPDQELYMKTGPASYVRLRDGAGTTGTAWSQMPVKVVKAKIVLEDW